jgi:hypothetical protein
MPVTERSCHLSKWAQIVLPARFSFRRTWTDFERVDFPNSSVHSRKATLPARGRRRDLPIHVATLVSRANPGALGHRRRSAFLVGKRNSGAGGYSSGPRVEETRRELPLAVARHLADGLEFPNDTSTVNARDGAEWILEAVRDGRYLLRVTWSPADGAFRDGCLSLVLASTLRITGRVY